MVDSFIAGMVILLAVAVAAGWLSRVLRAPAVLGFLIAGTFVGPSGLGVFGPSDVNAFADLGLILLLFTSGLSLSPESLLRAGRQLATATVLQFGGTALVVLAFLWLFTDLGFIPSLLVGVAVAPSSTAILAKHLSDRGEQDTTTGMVSTTVSVLQDAGVLVVMVLLPLLGVSTGADWRVALGQTVVGLVGVAIALTLGRRAIAFVLRRVVGPTGPQMKALFAVLVACGGAWLATLIGWSTALGAFFAGLVLSSADERHQIAADVMPFRDVFNAVFFVSLGMLVNLGHVASIAGLVLVATLATLAMKSVVAALGVRLAGWPAALSLNAGIGLCTISEFGYVFGGEAARTGLLSNSLFQTVVGVIVGTMMLGTLLLPAAGRVSTAVLRRIHAGPEESPSAEEGPSDHMIVVGYGTHGTNLAQVLRDLNLPYAVIEYDDALATEARRDASHVVVGDATRLSILQRAGLERARALAVTLSDVQAAVRTVAQARNSCPDLFILARVAFLDRLDDLKEAGADLVVPEDYEASIEIIAHAFKHLGVSDHVIDAQVSALRAGRYAMLRGRATDRAAMTEFLRALELSVIETYFLGEGSPVCGRSLADSRLRAATGVTVLAVVRQGEAAPNPTPDYTLLAGDTLVLLGAHAQLARARALLEGMDGEAPKNPPEEDEEIVPSSSVEAQRQPEPQEG